MKVFLIPTLTLFSVVAIFAPHLLDAQTPAGDFSLIKGGTFTMGSPTTESWRGKDEIQHRVTVDDFYMGKYEVTQKEYREIIGTNPSNFTGDTLPVENVTWFDAIQYCNARSRKEGLTPAYTISGGGNEVSHVTWNRAANGYRLPTEAEWEYACRAETTTPFSTGNNITVQQANYYGTYPYNIEQNYFSQNKLDVRPGEYREKTVSVGSFAANKLGLFDMHGNVWEWCWDWYGEYSNTAQTDPIGLNSGTFRVNRGGGWNDFAKNLRSAYRAATPPNNGSFNLGFRLVRNGK